MTKAGELSTFRQNLIQRILSRHTNVRHKKILKARQEGVSTNQIIEMLDYTCFHRNKNCLILADCDKNIRKLFRIVKTAYTHMPDRYRPKLDRGGGSMYEFYFPKENSRIGVALESRGESVHRLHISEAAFIKDTDRIDGTLETVPLHTGFVTYETTANGMANHYYKFWKDRNGYMPFFFPWYFHKEYQLPVYGTLDLLPDEEEFRARVQRKYNLLLTDEQMAFRRHKMKTNRLFAQEYAEDERSCFLTSGTRVIDLEIIERLQADAHKPLKTKGDWYFQYEPYNKDKRYVIGADVAEGVRQDYSVAYVIELSSRTEVACIRSNNWKPREFAEKLYNLGAEYQTGSRPWPLLGVELNNHGHAVVQKLEDLNYKNLFSYNEKTSATEKQNGWKTTPVTRPRMVDNLIDAVEEEMVTFHTQHFFDECTTLVDNGGKIEAAAGEHDDCFIAGAIALQMVLMDDTGNYDNLREKIFVG